MATMVAPAKTWDGSRRRPHGPAASAHWPKSRTRSALELTRNNVWLCCVWGDADVDSEVLQSLE